MITNPLYLLLVLALLSAVLHFGYKQIFPSSRGFYVVILVYVVSGVLSYIKLFSLDLKSVEVVKTTLQNLLPAIIFLTFLRTDFKSLWYELRGFFLNKKGEKPLGCAFEMGAKRYWVVVTLALGVSLFCQVFMFRLGFFSSYGSVVLAAVFGILARYTLLRNVAGSLDVARTMVYLFVSLLGVMVVVQWSVLHFALHLVALVLFSLVLF
jgi:uncharacterized membrane protein